MVSKLEYIQHEMLRIAIEFHHFCEENKLHYAICGGTLLGAIRHKGFIPWDDDFDVFMMREDYDKFIGIWEDKSDISLIKVGDDNYYKLSTPAKLHNPSTLIVENDEIENGITEEYFTHGVFIDIFPLDIYPDNFIGKMLNEVIGRLNIKKSLSKFPMTSLPVKHRVILKIFKFIPQVLINFLVDSSVSYLNKNKHGKVGYGVETAITNLYIDPKAIIPFKKENCIDGHDFYMPANPDMYLKHRFKDYMELPSINNRKSHISKLFVNDKEFIDEKNK